MASLPNLVSTVTISYFMTAYTHDKYKYDEKSCESVIVSEEKNVDFVKYLHNI